MSQSDMWRWADEQGEQRLVAAEELRTAIGSGLLPPSTLVWREGMSAWVPAISVEEFAEAIPNVTDGGTAIQPVPTNPANSPAPGPARSTLQGLAARELYAAVKAEEKEPAKEKRTPSVAPPRPNLVGAKPAAAAAVKPQSQAVKTLRPNFGPAIPAAPRLPSDGPAKPALAPRPVGAIRAPATNPPPAHVPPPVAAPAPVPARAPSTSTIDKDWSIADDETTNIPGKTAPTAPRPEPPAETASHEEPSPRDAAQAQPSRARTSPPPSPHAERRPTEESTESSTFQFAKNTLSIRAVKPSASKGDKVEGGTNPSARSNDPLALGGAPPGLMESYAKQPVTTHESKTDDAPPTAPSADLGLTDDLIPAYAGSTTRMPSLPAEVAATLAAALPAPLAAALPAPPKMRETTLTAMLPIDFHDGPAADDDEEGKLPHEVSRTVRLDLSELDKARKADPGPKPVRPDPIDGAGRNAPIQFKAPPTPAPPQQDGTVTAPFGQTQPGTAHATTGPALRAVQTPEGQPPAQLPINALLMSGAMLITMVVGAFFLGRCSVKPNVNNAPTARTGGFANAVRVVQDNLPKPPKPCWVVKQPARLAPVVSNKIPFELLTLASGKVAIGYAKSDDEAVGIEVLPSTGQVDEDYVDKARSEIARVTPTGKSFFISTVEPSGSLKSMIPVNADKPFYLGIADKQLAWSDQPSGAATRIWPINEDDTAGGIRVLSFGSRGILTAFRTGSSRQNKVFAGLLGQDRKPVTNLVQVAGSGGQAGEPMIGANGREVAVVFGDQAGEQTPWKLRIGHAPIGKIPATSTMFEVPPGGPGGDANSPAITGLADGRWVMVWTEGSSYSKVVRAQTFAPNFTLVGDPIVLSPPSGNYGSSMIGLVGNYVTVVFLLKGRSNNELWGSVLQCG